jgi:hypothetical protein
MPGLGRALQTVEQAVAEGQQVARHRMIGDRVRYRLEPAGNAAVERVVVAALVVGLMGLALDLALRDGEGGVAAAAIAPPVGHVAVRAEVVPALGEGVPMGHGLAVEDPAHGKAGAEGEAGAADLILDPGDGIVGNRHISVLKPEASSATGRPNTPLSF